MVSTKEKSKIYYWKNRKAILAKQKRLYASDPERYRSYCRKWKKNNPKKVEAKNERYKKSPEGIYQKLRSEKRKISKAEFVKWYQRQKKKCYYCGELGKEIDGKIFRCWKKGRLQVDRKDSSKFYEKGNMVLACPICNFIKGNYFTYKEMLILGKTIAKIKKSSRKGATNHS